MGFNTFLFGNNRAVALHAQQQRTASKQASKHGEACVDVVDVLTVLHTSGDLPLAWRHHCHHRACTRGAFLHQQTQLRHYSVPQGLVSFAHDRETQRNRDREMERQTDADGETERRRDRQTEKRTDRQSHVHTLSLTHTHSHNVLCRFTSAEEHVQANDSGWRCSCWP